MLTPDILEKAMKMAAAEGRKWLGATSPNPPVGAVALDTAGNILAITAHHRAGEAHAEPQAIEICRTNGTLPQLDTLCITLEPCNHQGRTPPCTQAIIKAGIRNITFGTRDPNPHVKGGGIDVLRTAGITITEGILEQECRQLMHAFAYQATTGKPWITIKRALTTEDSMLPPPDQKTFTSPKSLRLAHRLRKKADAIITGSGTILADNPFFTVRHVPDHKNKRRWLAILDRRGRIPADYIAAAKTRDLDVLIHTDIDETIADLTARGAQDILVEAGPTLSQTLLDSGVWTMSVTIRQANPNIIDVAFKTQEPMPFDTRQFCWDYFLPQD